MGVRWHQDWGRWLKFKCWLRGCGVTLEFRSDVRGLAGALHDFWLFCWAYPFPSGKVPFVQFQFARTRRSWEGEKEGLGKKERRRLEARVIRWFASQESSDLSTQG